MDVQRKNIIMKFMVGWEKILLVQNAHVKALKTQRGEKENEKKIFDKN